ncbi:serine protease [Pseudorhodoferax sp. Leaf274]|uniref:S1 family peptidase n=1 Tax=Pseudorhodoferax sp. Leaf274 TaxID=1736318 RepID=UPI0007026177|nr:serine protease [Pseudorhodoferax sp. Leaf274]KQP43236.1 peptidase S1 [Pseudorhodoferax sp. Leaf274]
MAATRRRWIALCGVGWLLCVQSAQAQFVELIEKTKPSILIVGTYKATSSPRFNLRGTGFVAGDGNLAITNAHVLPKPDEPSDGSDLVVQVRMGRELQMRTVTVLEIDRLRDLALLRFSGDPAPVLALGDSDAVKEGQTIAYTGFPIGGALGFSPVTHRGMVSSITPIVLPAANGQALSARAIRNARDGSFDIFQLDGTAYPGNSGGPVFDVATGQVIAVINMVYVRGTRETALSQPSGITYAIPANFIVPLLQRHQGQPR